MQRYGRIAKRLARRASVGLDRGNAAACLVLRHDDSVRANDKKAADAERRHGFGRGSKL